MKTLHGVLDAYWEQGWEGRIEFTLLIEGQKSPGVFLQDGQHLTIYTAEGQILWTGKLHFVKRNLWFDHHKLKAGIWSDVKQRGVSYAQWLDWFWRKPPLKAALEIED